MALVFKKIKYDDIFTNDFSSFNLNNQICFSKKIAVIYGPNGTGKTSLTKVLSGRDGTQLAFSYNKNDYDSGNCIFYIINDQNKRNIITGEAKDILLGDNIRHEIELQERLITERELILSKVLKTIKETFGISSKSSSLINLLCNSKLSDFVKDCANNKSKGNNSTPDLIAELSAYLELREIPEFDSDKLKFIQDDLCSTDSIIKQLEVLKGEKISPNTHVVEIEENTEAIKVLSRFHKDKCVVCDNENIDREKLLDAKTANKKKVLESLDEEIKKAIDKVTPFIPEDDPFSIKSKLLTAIGKGDVSYIKALIEEIENYEKIYCSKLENEILNILKESNFKNLYDEYQHLISEKPDITDEDYLYICEIINNNMNKSLNIERDGNKQIKIYLSNKDFMGKDREELPLSAGEQNFISLMFEFLKAKNSNHPIVVIDDPISSFDSIYKNKIVYALAKVLEGKKCIILTHNTDLIRLLDGQRHGCFELYLLNNTEGEVNGFIALKEDEQKMLMSLAELLKAFREEIPFFVVNSKLFLISVIPFMRGYANIINNRPIYESLTQVMHGYKKTEKVDIALAYKKLFGETNSCISFPYLVSVDDILKMEIEDEEIILDNKKYPLLNKTLRHSFIYLYLRLLIEKKLVERFKIDTVCNDQLGKIILAAYPDANNIEQIRNRVYLTSKKTLINEFNHFEGNLSIFQPAIDISDSALKKEYKDIMDFIGKI